jgi:hypothetical protein
MTETRQTFAVVLVSVDKDGCPQDVIQRIQTGTRHECTEFLHRTSAEIAQGLMGTGLQYDLMNVETGRFASWVC